VKGADGRRASAESSLSVCPAWQSSRARDHAGAEGDTLRRSITNFFADYILGNIVEMFDFKKLILKLSSLEFTVPP
jgi:hypothetical protein